MIVNRRSIFLLRLLSDLLLLNISFLVAAVWAQSWTSLIDRYYMFFLLIALNVLWVASANYFKFYDELFSRNFPVQFTNLIKKTALQITVSVLFIFLWKEDLFTRYFIIFYAILLVLLISARIIVTRKALKYLRKHGKNIRNLLIVGNGEPAQSFKTLVTKNPDFGYNLKGMIEENKITTENFFSEEFDDLLKKESIDEVVIALSETSPQITEKIIRVCDRNAIRIHIVPDYFKFVSKKYQVTLLGELPIVTVRNEPLAEAHWRFVKRLFDIVFSLIIILGVLSWTTPLIAILIKVFSPGPVFYSQKRLGLRNKPFKFYKFRTMVINETSDNDSYLPVVNGDKRITKVGRLLRRTNLDELPQFINVLKGDMSVVGPRPHFIPYNEVYSEYVDEIKLRSRVKPGLTGWAQIHGLRGDSPNPIENEKRTRKRIEYDIWYIENWSLWLDIQIIFLTLWQMIKGKTRAV